MRIIEKWSNSIFQRIWRKTKAFQSFWRGIAKFVAWKLKPETRSFYDKMSQSLQILWNYYEMVINRTLNNCEDIWIYASCQKQYLTRSLRSLVRYCFYHSNIKSTSRNPLISSISYDNLIRACFDFWSQTTGINIFIWSKL